MDLATPVKREAPPATTTTGTPPTNAQLDTNIKHILETGSLEDLSNKKVRRMLEAMFGCDLTERKAYIKSQVEVFLDALASGEEDNTSSRSAKKKKSSRKKTKSTPPPAGRTSSGGGSGFMKLLRLSPPLAVFLGTEHMARPTIVKSLWEYIKENDLQNPDDKREIVFDRKLREVFQRDSVTMFSINKYLKFHVKKMDDKSEFELTGCGDSGDDETPRKKSGKSKKRHASSSDDDDSGNDSDDEQAKRKAKKKKKKQKGDSGSSKNNAFTKPWVLSEDMAKFMGQRAAGRGAVVKQLWVHIKAQGLQDESNKRNINNDAVLKRLTGVKKMTMFNMNKYIQKHFIVAADESSDMEDDGDEEMSSMPKLEQ